MRLRNWMLLAYTFLSISASLPQAPATTLRPEDLRVASVGYRLAVAGRAYCTDPYPLTGMVLHHLAEYDGEARASEIALRALDRGPGILATVSDSPAARAGLIAGDVLLALNGATFADPRLMVTDRRRGQWRAPIEASEAWLEAALRRGPVELRIMRAGQMLHVRLQPEQGCAARVRLARSNQANAFATGTYVVVTTRILAELHSDDELAILIGHELAHNLLRHEKRIDEQMANRDTRARGRAQLLREAEQEADRLGLKLAAAAGYDLRAAIPMWRRIHAKFAGGLHLIRTHPSLKARERLIEEVIAQLEGEKARGIELPSG